QAMLAGVASIKAQQTRMNIIGNNLANVNTTAFKGSRVNFHQMIAQTVRGATRPGDNRGGTNPVQFGLGVMVAGTDIMHEQGSLNATNRPTDLALQGSGFFILGDNSQSYYSRDGSFDLDANGDLVHRTTGLYVMGWTADSEGEINPNQQITPASKLNIPFGSVTALQATTRANFKGNLKSDAAPTDVATTTITVYDSLGAPHVITLNITNRTAPPGGTPPPGATSSWDWEAYEGTTLIGSFSDPGNEPMYFDANGRIINGDTVGVASLTGSAGALDFDVNLDFSQITQNRDTFSLQSTGQNGFPPGSLNGFSIGADGTITGTFTNSMTRTLGRIATSVFSNPSGLEYIGSNLWTITGNSGAPEVGEAGSRGRGSLAPGFLEQSNVDIGSEFTDLIVTQRGFQANTRVVTTVDEMLQDLITMKR
ncbi:MAG TPA: flagellar hook protein FlgE, partial [Fimbriimonadaceae bacterium]|nr:flagellar hook protein FlgE [Fimbriimonadaceae bacterium]